MKRINSIILKLLLGNLLCWNVVSLAAGLVLPSAASQREMIISTAPDVAKRLKQVLGIEESSLQLEKSAALRTSPLVLLKIQAQQLEAISQLIHREFHRCGGFMIEADGASLAELTLESAVHADLERDKGLYQINQQVLVEKISREVSEGNLLTTIKALSSNPNRYYRSSHGKASQQWLKEQWQALTKTQWGVSVDFFAHGDFPQPSVIVSWKGSLRPEEIVVLGGHGDSIAGMFSRESAPAPGADDNASGIATITEVLRLLVAQNFRPERSIHFISYAAEEVGLRGSAEIARHYKNQGVNVQGVMQLDMVNFFDGRNDMVLITDNTDNEQNTFVKNLVAAYLPRIRLGENPCGYACSDHASWTRQGYPASFPFEAAMEDYNSAIHTARDTLDRSNNNARHAVPFVTLAAAFVVELSML